MDIKNIIYKEKRKASPKNPPKILADFFNGKVIKIDKEYIL